MAIPQRTVRINFQCLISNLIATLSLFASSPLWAQETEVEHPGAVGSNLSSGKIFVEFLPIKGQTIWMSKALELTFKRDLRRNPRLNLEEDLGRKLQTCATGDLSCILKVHQDLGTDIVFVGRVTPDRIHYRIYETWTQAIVRQGEMEVTPGESSLTKLRQDLLRAIKPFTEKGGLLDQKPVFVPNVTSQVGSPSDVQVSSGDEKSVNRVGSHWITMSVGIWMFLPYLLGTLLVRRRKLYFKKIRNPLIWTSVMVLGLLLVGLVDGAFRSNVALQLQFNEALQNLSSYSLSNIQWSLTLFSGMAYGWLILLSMKMIFPTLEGIRRIRHWNLLELLRAWATISVLRAITLMIPTVLYVWVALKIGEAIGLSRNVQIFSLVPVLGLLSFYWFFSMLEVLSLYLDQEYAYGGATEEHPWHKELQAYFFGYLKRLGLDSSDRLLKRVLFLPCHQSHILTYGSPLSHYRIVIDRDLLDFAIGRLSEDPGDFNPNVLDPSFGALFPGGAGDVDVERRKRFFQKIRTIQHDPERVSMLVNWVYGFILPERRHESIPLISNNTQDLMIVEQLLTEQERERAQGLSHLDEVDDTDPTDRDFLFGLLLHQFGMIKRQETSLLTPLHALHRSLHRFPWWIAQGLDQGFIYGRKIFYRYWAVLADSYAALNFGLHHFMQYLYLFVEHEPRLITARADKLRLHRVALAILKRTREKMHYQNENPLVQVAVDRLVWLSQYFYSPIEVGRVSALRFVIYGTIAVSGIWVGVNLIYNAWKYHPSYEQVMLQEEQKVKSYKERIESEKKNEK